MSKLSGQKTKQSLNTKQKIIDALIRLEKEHPGKLPTVMELCQNLGIYRSTFYNYYSSVSEVIDERSEHYIEQMLDTGDKIFAFSPKQSNLKEVEKKIFQNLMTICLNNREELLFLLSPRYNFRLRRELFNRIVKGTYASLSEVSEPFREYNAYYHAAGVVSLAHIWLQNENLSVDQLTDLAINLFERSRQPFVLNK